MSASAIGAIGAEPVSGTATQLSKQVAEAAKQSQSSGSIHNSVPANSYMNSPESASSSYSLGSNDGFVDTVLDNVYTEIDKIGANMPKVSEGPQTEVDKYISEMKPTDEALNPGAAHEKMGETDQAVKTLSKTFDHAIFMAMVNQVISGVGDTSRTLIRQS